MGSDSCTHSAQQVHNSKTQWSGAQCIGHTSLCLAIVHREYFYHFPIYIKTPFLIQKSKLMSLAPNTPTFYDFF
jgi:hypothetical protein